jgi:hypothetical protein
MFGGPCVGKNLHNLIGVGKCDFKATKGLNYRTQIIPYYDVDNF